MFPYLFSLEINRALRVILNSLSSKENQKNTVTLFKCAVSSTMVIVDNGFLRVSFSVLAVLIDFSKINLIRVFILKVMLESGN